MKLHENKELFQDAIVAASQTLDIPEIYIEKDYWVTVALYEIFHSDMAAEAVFKGGTALSKCHKLIERFSEDIDLVVLRRRGETDSKLRGKIRKISKVVEAIMPEIDIVGLTNKKGNIRKTAHQYEKIYSGDFGQVGDHIILEATWLGNFEPYTTETLSCYIAELMLEKGQSGLIEEYGMVPFEARVLSKERTLCEKIMSLVRFSRQGDPFMDLPNKIRHVYDIHMMLLDQEIKNFFNSDEFDVMLQTVGEDDLISYKNDNEWLYEHPAKAIIFDQPLQTWEKIKATYLTTFKDLVVGELPAEEAIINTLEKVANRLKEIDWDLSRN